MRRRSIEDVALVELDLMGAKQPWKFGLEILFLVMLVPHGDVFFDGRFLRLVSPFRFTIASTHTGTYGGALGYSRDREASPNRRIAS